MAKKQKKKKNVLRTIGYISLILLVLAIAGVILFCTAICLTTEPIDTSMFEFNMASEIYYENASGEKVVIQRLTREENRTWVEFEKIPLDMQNAFVAIEDERFYSHPGFDIKRLGGATLNTALRLVDKNRSVYGGSTITQQLVKNLTKEDERSVLRKAREIYRAVRLEQDLSKNQILELYLNTIYLSQNCNGVASAAKVYFDKDIEELSLAECASIAGITQYPSRYDPYLNKEANKEKQELVLAKMLELDMITESEYNQAINEELVFKKAEEYSTTHYSYFVDTLIEEVLYDLINYHNYTPAMAQNVLYTGGLQIKCTIDPEIQAILDDVYTDVNNYHYNASTNELLQSAMVITDATTGEIKAITGGMGDKSGSRTYNRATAPRQPGSTIKPLAVYAPAIDSGLINAATILNNESVTFTIAGSAPWTLAQPSSQADTASVRKAIASSWNIPPAKLVNEMGVEHSYNFLSKNLGITSLVEKKETASGTVSDKALAALSLGGLTEGISPIELSAAYAAFINDGYHTKAHTYTEIYNHNDEILFKKQVNTHRAMKSSTATIMTDLMTSVVTSGTGTAARFAGVDIAGKTGTTDNTKDKWFVGFTPSLVGVTWVGYDTPTEISSAKDKALAIELWNKVMSKIDYSDRPTSFEEVLSYDGLSSYYICEESGLHYSETCTSYSGSFKALLSEDDANKIEVCSEELHLPEEPIQDPLNPEEDEENTETSDDTPDISDVPVSPSIPAISDAPIVPDIPVVPSTPIVPDTPISPEEL